MPDLDVIVTPRASADRVGPFDGGALRVRVTRPPADGEANRAVIRLVADALDLAPSRLQLVGGAKARRKRLRVDLEPGELDRRLARIGLD